MTERLCALQVLRAIAAGLVIFAHAQDTYLTKVSGTSMPLLSSGLGELGVKLFFCISGFMIYGAGARMQQGAASVAEFAWRRVVRVVPLYWAATMVYAAKLALQGDMPNAAEWAGSLLFITYEGYVIRPILGVGWTLNFEMFFYAVFSASLLLNRRLRGLSVAACFGMMFMLKAVGVVAPNGFAPTSYLFLLTNVCLLYFLMGMALGWVRPRCARWVQAAGLSSTGALYLAVGVICVYLVLLACAPGQAWLPWWARWGEAVLGCFVSLSVGACLMENTGSSAAPVAPWFRALQIAGDASYSSYLTHGFVMGPSARLLALAGAGMPVGVFATLMVVGCTLTGVLVHHAFEKPLLKRFSKPPWLAAPARRLFQAPNRSSSSGR